MGLETALILGGASIVGSAISGGRQANAAEEAARLQANAATEAARLQAQSTEQQIAAQQAAAAQQRQDLQPYAHFGQSFMDPTQAAVANLQSLYTDPTSIMQNPMFQAIQAQNQQDIMQNAAVRGRLGTGGTQQHLQDAALRTGFDVLNQERSAQLQNIAALQGLVGMGQNAAASQGAGALQTGANIANTMQTGTANQANLTTDAAAALAAGEIGQANAFSNAVGGVVGGIGTIFGAPTVGTGV